MDFCQGMFGNLKVEKTHKITQRPGCAFGQCSVQPSLKWLFTPSFNNLRVSVMHTTGVFHLLSKKSFQDMKCCSHLNFKFGGKRHQEGLYNSSYSARRGNFKRARGIWVMSPSPIPPRLAGLWADSQAGRAAGDAWFRSKAVLPLELPSLFIYLLFPRRVIYCCLHS